MTIDGQSKNEIKNNLNPKNMTKTYHEMKEHYLYNGVLYQVEFKGNIPNEDMNRPIIEIVDDYFGETTVCAFNGWYETFEGWNTRYLKSLDELPFDINKATKVESTDLEIAIKNIKDNCKKEFNDFFLDGSLYSNNDSSLSYGQIFPFIAKPIRKLVNENATTAHDTYILEIEVLDGSDANTKHKFIRFHEFITNYTLGCAIKVVDSNDINGFDIKNYFDIYFCGIPDDELLPF